MKSNQKGSVLAIVLMCLSVMLIMTYALSGVVANNYKSVINYSDIKISENYARVAMFQAESIAYDFDLENNMESPNVSCEVAASTLKGLTTNDYNNLDCTNIRRAWALNNLINKQKLNNKTGGLCNFDDPLYKGFCYQSLDNSDDFNSSSSFQPWTISDEAIEAPCDSFTKPLTGMTILDDKKSRYSISYDVNNKSLCANPRILIEPINLNFKGNYNLVKDKTELYESNSFTQANNSFITIYKAKQESYFNFKDGSVADTPIIPSARLYRLTVEAFGKSGSSKVIYQEIILVNGFSGSELRSPKDTVSNKAFRVIRMSNKWIR